jgi:hypothetical protein
MLAQSRRTLLSGTKQGSDGILLALVDDKTPTQNVFFWTGDSYDHAQVDF